MSICAIASTAFSQDAKYFSIGAAFISSGSVYSGVSSSSRFSPSISYEDENYKISVQDGVAYKLVDNESSKLTASLSPNFKPHDSSDSTVLAGMSRKMTLDAKLSGSIDIVRGTALKVSYSSELTNEHGGSLLDLAVSQFMPIGGQPMIFSLGTRQHDSKLALYQYGVKTSEATLNRLAYAPGTTNVTYVSLNTFYDLSRSISAFLNVSANFLPNNAKNSPIVSKGETISALAGISYRF
ncbi:MAG: MipA/OmpV family protein [Burkholderiaceae bacterium]